MVFDRDFFGFSLDFDSFFLFCVLRTSGDLLFLAILKVLSGICFDLF